MITLEISKAGSCIRTLDAARRGLLPSEGAMPEYLRIAAREGRRHEAFIREDIREHGWESMALRAPIHCGVCNREGYHVELEEGPFRFIGHLDDLVHPIGKPEAIHVGEYKALGRFTCQKIRSSGLSRTYATQVSLYSYAMARLAGMEKPYPVLFVLKNRDTGFHHIVRMETPPLELDAILDRLELLRSESEELAPCDAAEGSLDAYSCTSLCDDSKGVVKPDLAVLPASLKVAVTQWRGARSIQAQIDDWKAESQAVFGRYMDSLRTDAVEIDGLRIRRIGPGLRTIYDIPPEIKEQYARKVERKGYLRITDKGEVA